MTHLGIDLGGTYARAGITDERGRLLASARVALSDRAPERVAEAIAGVAREATRGQEQPTTCGVGVAGMIERDTGVVVNGPNLGWRGVPFARMLGERLGRPVRLVNDLWASAWGEFKVGAGAGVDDILVILVGSGVGGAIITNGTLVIGSSGVGGEIGHMKIVPDGRLCGCGQRGCVEAYAGGRKLIEQMEEAVASTEPTLLRERSRGDAAALTPVLLEEAALAGDAVAKRIHSTASLYLGMCVGSQVSSLNPARLILGGGVLRRCPAMRAAVIAGVDRSATEASRRGLTIVEPALGDDNGLIGAALLGAAQAQPARAAPTSRG